MAAEHKYITLDELGHAIEVDLHTGEIKKLENAIEAQGDFFDKYQAVRDSENNLVYIPRDTPAEVIKELQGNNYHFPYSPLMADKIIQRVVEGGFITKICKQPGFPPYPTLAKWRKQHPEFDEAYKQAVRDRAEAFLAKAVDEAEHAAPDRDEINLAKFKSDVYRYVAKVGDPDAFTEKQQVKADVAVKGVIVETGIRRPGDPGFNKDETRDVSPELEGSDE
jgi:hypothetical protein